LFLSQSRKSTKYAEFITVLTRVFILQANQNHTETNIKTSYIDNVH